MLRNFALASVSMLAMAGGAIQAHAATPADPAPQAQTGKDKAATPVNDGTNNDAQSQQQGLSDIVVTATRQATNLQDTPIAITAVTSQTLETRGLKSVADLSDAVPNATFRKVQGAFGPGVSAFIRGIGQADTSLGSEPSVAYYVDDVYYPLILGSNFDLLDLDHIEVLRGPQGTLFGRNALAGAVNIVSKTPSFTEASAYIEATTGSYNRMDIRAGFSVPLTSTLALSVSGVSKKRDGYQNLLDFRCQMIVNGTPALAGTLPFTNVINTPAANFKPSDCKVGTLGGEDVKAMRGTVQWRPAPNVKISISGDYTRDRSENPADQLVAVPGTAGANVIAEAAYFGVAYDSRFVTGSPYKAYATYCDPVGSGVIVPGDTFHNGFGPQRGGACFPDHVSVDNWGVSGKAVIGLGSNIDLTGILGYRNMTDIHGFDVDNSPIALEHTLLYIGEHYLNGELRLSGKSSLVDWLVGGFYFDGTGYTHAITYSPQSGFFKVQNIAYKPRSYAGFANATIKPFDKFDIVLGGRYSHDEKFVDFSNIPDTGIGPTIFQVFPNTNRFDWKAGIDYHITDDVMFYATASTGARLPGYNARPQQATQVVSFAGDETLAYEAGIKADLFDRKLRLNVTGFYTDYKTRITGVNGAETNLTTGAATAGTCVLIPLPSGGAGATQCRSTPYDPVADGARNLAGGIGVTSIPRTYYVNTPGKTKGFEVELEARPVSGLLINGAVGYAHFTSPDLQAAGRANDRLAGLPEWNANAGIQYTADVPAIAGTITPRVDWFYTGDIAMSAVRNTYNQAAYSIVNARLTYDNHEHRFSVSAGVTNLFNKLYYLNYFVYQDIGFPNVNAQPSAPRQWSLTLSKKF